MRKPIGALRVSLDIFKAEVFVFFDQELFYDFVYKVTGQEDDREEDTWRSTYRRLTDKDSEYLVRAMYICPDFIFEDIPHEVSHMIMDLFDDKGIPICLQNTETFSYTLGYVCDKIFIHRLTKKKK